MIFLFVNFDLILKKPEIAVFSFTQIWVSLYLYLQFCYFSKNENFCDATEKYDHHILKLQSETQMMSFLKLQVCFLDNTVSKSKHIQSLILNLDLLCIYLCIWWLECFIYSVMNNVIIKNNIGIHLSYLSQ